VLPFTGLNSPGGVAVDTADNLYVTDMEANRVVKLPAG
jgi:serine/threonine protein kinase, bacterial